MANTIFSTVLVVEFIRRLVRPFEKWEAFKLGIIDKDGKILIKKKDRKTKAERKALTTFDIMIINLKKLLGKLPFGKTKLATFTAALFLIREHAKINDDSGYLLESIDVEKSYLEFHNENKDRIAKEYDVDEEAPANVASQIIRRPAPLFKKKKKKKKKNLINGYTDYLTADQEDLSEAGMTTPKRKNLLKATGKQLGTAKVDMGNMGGNFRLAVGPKISAPAQKILDNFSQLFNMATKTQKMIDRFEIKEKL